MLLQKTRLVFVYCTSIEIYWWFWGINFVCLHLSALPSVTRVTAVLAHSSGELLLLGTEGGHVFIVEVPGFRELEERNISLDQVASRSAATTHQHTAHCL